MNPLGMFNRRHTLITMQTPAFKGRILLCLQRQIRITQQGSPQLDKIKAPRHQVCEAVIAAGTPYIDDTTIHGIPGPGWPDPESNFPGTGSHETSAARRAISAISSASSFPLSAWA